MSDVLAVVAAGLRMDQARLEQASINAANATTPGYRRAVLAPMGEFAGFERALANVQGRAEGPFFGAGAALMPALVKGDDLTPGALVKSGRVLDIAVEGRGFVCLSDGERTVLTRTASLRIDERGDLVGPKGLRVMGVQRGLAESTSTDSSLAISVRGDVNLGDGSLGRIRLVAVDDVTKLRSRDGVLFDVSADQVHDLAADEGVLRSGFLEGSNTNNLSEMTAVLEAVRHFESLTRLAQGYDEILGRAIQKLGEV